MKARRIGEIMAECAADKDCLLYDIEKARSEFNPIINNSKSKKNERETK